MMAGLVLLMLLIGSKSVEGDRGGPSLRPVRWLLGQWTSHGEGRITTETWKDVSADTFEGFVVSRSRDTGEMVPVENLRLAAMSGSVLPRKVPEHVLPIAFRMTACDERTAVFENPDHDFPRVIDYRLDEDGALTVRVTDGADQGFTLRYARGSADSPDCDRSCCGSDLHRGVF